MSSGLRWRIGDGRSAPIYNANWLPDVGFKKVGSIPTLPVASVVRDLMNPLGQWDVDLIGLHFSDDERASILKIPLNCFHLPDQ